MGMISEFKDFAMKGNLVDMAVAVVMGGAFGKVVTSFIDGMFMPFVGLITGGVDFKERAIELVAAHKDDAGKDVAAVMFKYGAFITVTVEFIIVAFVMFMVIRAMNKAKTPPPPPPPAGPTPDQALLMEIRDALKK
ncbi:MAG: hypothetical protein RI894_288 [Bacteroidota bacterium]|jgi:large conductance mechanosensitive channel